MKVTIFGTGYVGLVTGTCFSQAGIDVLCIDPDQDKIERLKQGEIPIYEPGLEPMVRTNIDNGRLKFSTSPTDGVEHGEFLFIAVGTPPGEDGSADLNHVLEVATEIGTHMDEYKIIINKSTVPVGTAEKVQARVNEELARRDCQHEFVVVSNPEFLKEGSAVNDFMRPDRIVVGSDDGHALERIHSLYAPFNRNREKLIAMDVRSAELTKYAANAMLATKISFINELAAIADSVGADIEHIRYGIGADPRIGPHFIYAGAGYGGSCFPKDVKALIHTAHEHDAQPTLLESVERVNQRQKMLMFEKLQRHFDNNLRGRNIAVWGLAFKPNTDDMREAPSRVLLEALWQAGATVRAYDPVAMDVTRGLYGDRPDLVMTDDPYMAASNADAVVLMTEWKDFWQPDLERLSSLMKGKVIFDGRNIYDRKTMQDAGFTYYAIGR